MSSNSQSHSYPSAHRPDMVGHYKRASKSGGGRVYDEVLEYRVWESKTTRVHSQNSQAYHRFMLASPSEHLPNKHGFPDYKAFATYEEALAYYNTDQKKFHIPHVLILQKEHINEPFEGVMEHIKEERITEWQPQWLQGNKREEGTIERLIQKEGASSEVILQTLALLLQKNKKK